MSLIHYKTRLMCTLYETNGWFAFYDNSSESKTKFAVCWIEPNVWKLTDMASKESIECITIFHCSKYISKDAFPKMSGWSKPTPFHFARESIQLVSFQRDIQAWHCIELEKSMKWEQWRLESMSSGNLGHPFVVLNLHCPSWCLFKPHHHNTHFTCLLPHNHNPA